jgi:putative transposase
MAAYIDLNGVRAGMVEDPKEYRWCGYGEALGGGCQARKGLAEVTASFGRGSDWRVVSRPLQEGISKKKVQKVLAQQGELSQHELLRCRVRYFTDGVVLGSRGFVNEVFEEFRGKAFATTRKEGALAMRGGGGGDLCTARDLRREPIEVL